VLAEQSTSDNSLLAVTCSPVGLAVASLAGYLLYANQSFLELLGLDPDAVRTRSNIRQASGGHISAAVLDAVAREGHEQQIRISQPVETGSRELLCSVSRVTQNATPMYLVLALQDFTAAASDGRRALQRALDWSAAQRLIGACSWRMSLDSQGSDIRRGVLDWSPQIDVLLAGSAPPTSLQDYLRLVVPEDRDRLLEAIDRAIAQGTQYTVDYDLLDHTGAVRNMRSSGIAFTDAGESGCKLTGIEIDISGMQSHSEHALLLESLLEGIDAPVYMVDRKFRYLCFNSAHADRMEATYGSRLRVGGSALEAIVDPPRRRRLASLLGRVFNGELMVKETEFESDRAGPSQWFDISFSPTRDAQGAIVGAVAVGKDISALKRAHHRHEHLNEELKRRVEQRTAELNAANHDLNVFLASISKDLQSLLHSLDAALLQAQREMTHVHADNAQVRLRKAREATAHMEVLVQDLLQLSCTAGHALRIEHIDLDELVREILRDLADSLKGRKIELDICRLPAIDTDRALVRQVFQNLLGNAIKFTATCKPARIRVWAEQIGGERVWSVADNGVGFSMQDAERVFAPFVRLHPELNVLGTGMGLMIVKRAVGQLGGRVWSESSPGRGATFHFTLSGRRAETE